MDVEVIDLSKSVNLMLFLDSTQSLSMSGFAKYFGVLVLFACSFLPLCNYCVLHLSFSGLFRLLPNEDDIGKDYL